MTRSNLKVLTHALVARIVVKSGRAQGVQFRHKGELQSAFCDREVLLCAGTFNSPQLLLLSGIGSAAEIAQFGIKPIHELPGVGKNLSEHPNARNVYQAKGRDSFLKFLRFDRATLAALQWSLFKTGPLTNNGSSANIFFRSKPDLARPDVQLICVSLHPDSKLWFPGIGAMPVHRYAARGGILHPKSRGWVRLRSSEPVDKPRIQFNMLQAKEDLDAMVAMMRMSRNIYRQAPLSELVERELFPGKQVSSDAELAEAIRASAITRSHPVGTCAMGVDENAVVDSRLRVRGIDGLRIIDASVMPDEPTGNTNVPTIMIAERAADFIRGKSLPRAELDRDLPKRRVGIDA